jgi:hypothetical protein
VCASECYSNSIAHWVALGVEREGGSEHFGTDEEQLRLFAVIRPHAGIAFYTPMVNEALGSQFAAHP